AGFSTKVLPERQYFVPVPEIFPEDCDPPLDDELTCAICRALLRVPMECRCRHVFCKGCILLWLNTDRTCPLCRVSVQAASLVPAHPLIQNMVGNVKVKCRSPGCSARVAASIYTTHLGVCEYKEVPCPHDLCEHRCPRRTLEDHVKTCPHRILTCELGCGAAVSAGQLENHSCMLKLRLQVPEICPEDCDPPLDEELTCAICHCLLRVPVECRCRHVFCKGCIMLWLNTDSTCPLCRVTVQAASLVPAHPLIQNMVENVKVKCRSPGCSARVAVSIYTTHLGECEFKEVPCPHDLCEHRCPRRALEDHVKTCPHRMLTCELGCGAAVSAIQLDNHSCVLKLRLQGKKLCSHSRDLNRVAPSVLLAKLADSDNTSSSDDDDEGCVYEAKFAELFDAPCTVPKVKAYVSIVRTYSDKANLAGFADRAGCDDSATTLAWTEGAGFPKCG
ncbi:hypothetical protein HPB47_027801, partial [Ixodes persulcatus]